MRAALCFTNLESVKGAELAANGKASLLFSLEKPAKTGARARAGQSGSGGKQTHVIIRAAVAVAWALRRRSNRALADRETLEKALAETGSICRC